MQGKLSNLAWDDYNNKYANKTSDSGKYVMTDTRNDTFGMNYGKIAAYNKQLQQQGKVPIAYMNTGMMDTINQIGKDPAFTKLRVDLQNAGVFGGGINGQWNETILSVQNLQNPVVFNKVRQAYTTFAQTMKQLGYQAINVDNLDFYTQGTNKNQKGSVDMGVKFQGMVADVIHSQGMAAIAKNAPELVNAPGSNYVQKYDGIVTENALSYASDTNTYKKFANSGKPVWNFQTKTSGKEGPTPSIIAPSWMDSYAVSENKQGWWEM
jgi:endo-alpha-1,4-polygalactosaminidase (GH114 family)